VPVGTNGLKVGLNVSEFLGVIVYVGVEVTVGVAVGITVDTKHKATSST
jgi:hypothetical protein